MKNWLILLVIIFVVTSVGGAAYLGVRSGQTQADDISRAPLTVGVTLGDVQQTVTAPGQMVGTQEVLLGMKVDDSWSKSTSVPAKLSRLGPSWLDWILNR